MAWNCLTPGGGVVISRQGYNQHKTENAIRVVRLGSTCATQLHALRADLASYVGEPDLLLRLDGSDEAGLRDSQLLEIWSAALKVATGDAKARPHSVRAASVQESAWPGWETAAAQWLSTGTSDLQHLGRWIDSLQADWTRTANAVAAAGHGDLRSAFDNYLSAWSLIRALAVESLLRRLPIGPGLVRQVGLNAAAVRKARSRNRNAFSGAAARQPFDEWSWLGQGLLRRMVKHPKNPPKTVAPTTLQHSEPRRVSRLDSVRYLIVRTLGLTKHRAIVNTGIPVSAALELERLVPDDDTRAELTRRARSSPQERGVEANIRVALSDDGLQIVDWLLGLDRATREFFRLCVVRESAAPTNFYQYRIWEPILESMPPRFSLSLRRGNAHFKTDEINFLRKFEGQLKSKGDKSIGERPVVSLVPRAKENQVLTARFTTVLRAALFVISNLKEEE